MTQAQAHTPGTWQVAGTRHSGDLKIGQGTRLHFVGPDGDAIAAVFFDMKTCRGLADAHLIAAAPDLLRLCKLVSDSFGGGRVITFSDADIQDFADAIAKAEGVAQ